MSNLDEVDRQERRQILIRLENEHAALDRKVAEHAELSGADQLMLLTTPDNNYLKPFLYKTAQLTTNRHWLAVLNLLY